MMKGPLPEMSMRCSVQNQTVKDCNTFAVVLIAYNRDFQPRLLLQTNKACPLSAHCVAISKDGETLKKQCNTACCLFMRAIPWQHRLCRDQFAILHPSQSLRASKPIKVDPSAPLGL